MNPDNEKKIAGGIFGAIAGLKVHNWANHHAVRGTAAFIPTAAAVASTGVVAPVVVGIAVGVVVGGTILSAVSSGLDAATGE